MDVKSDFPNPLIQRLVSISILSDPPWDVCPPPVSVRICTRRKIGMGYRGLGSVRVDSPSLNGRPLTFVVLPHDGLRPAVAHDDTALNEKARGQVVSIELGRWLTKGTVRPPTETDGPRPSRWCTRLSASSSPEVHPAAGIAITSSGSSTGSASAFASDSTLR